MWFLSGNQGARWRQVYVFIGAMTDVQFIIQAKRGYSFDGDISIDDIAFVDCAPVLPTGSCSRSQFTCSNQYCIDGNLQCDYADDCGDSSDEQVSISRNL
jgi:hypothetical protein